MTAQRLLSSHHTRSMYKLSLVFDLTHKSRWSLACWNWGFESRRSYGRQSVVSVVCCQAEVFVTADPSSRGDLPSVVYLSMIVKPR